EAGFFETRWFKTPRDPKAHVEMALATACHFNRMDVANWLIGLGVDLRAVDKNNMTPLHWAGANGNVDLATRLLDAGAPLEVLNEWDGTVLDSTAHFAAFMPIKGVDYGPVLDLFIARGADASVLKPYPKGNAV